ncbi:MAG TPA: phosphoesterase [Desulfobacteraceae bacterium]|nr:phosphoesterase [Desulfobacteraceae bacterium]|tara:strand:+ start:513 stop:1124 length:612 start_codon:yes stop_codon:yes gene_type:complete
MTKPIEKILCVDRASLPDTWVTRRTVMPASLQDFIAGCTKGGFFFADRPEAEQDKNKKQIIPYILLQTQDGKKTAVYNRKGSETRLHDLWSVGIGGHINPEDNAGPEDKFEDILVSGMTRELDEELIRRPASDPIEFCGIINEDITPVGSVHLGAVFKILTKTPDAYVAGEELYRFTWMDTDRLGTLTMELWSELALELLGDK